MLEITNKKSNDKSIVFVEGRVDSTNAGILDVEIEKFDTEKQLIIDVEKMEYISSAGLRVMLKYRKKHSDLEIINTSTDVYEIFDMTGFTEMMMIKRAYKHINLDGCKVIGQGANGKIYRIDQDTIIKVYLNPDSLEEIEHERDVARKALILGIPTAISYDIVKVGNCYASMFEMIDAKSLSDLLEINPQDVDKYSKMYVDLLKLIHSTEVPKGQLPDQKEILLHWIEDLKLYLPNEIYTKYIKLANEIPHVDTMIHGDYHTKNVMLQNGECILIDMDTLAVGHPILELASIYNAFIGFHVMNPEEVKDFLGYDYATAKHMWNNTLKLYYDTDDEAFLKHKENQAKALGFIRLLRRTIRREKNQELLNLYTNELCHLANELNSFID